MDNVKIDVSKEVESLVKKADNTKEACDALRYSQAACNAAKCADSFPLPGWAERRSNGDYMEIGAQLATRDGRRLGNAYVDRLEHHPELRKLAVAITDMGTVLRMTFRELQECFYLPAYVMRVDEARLRRNVRGL